MLIGIDSTTKTKMVVAAAVLIDFESNCFEYMFATTMALEAAEVAAEAVVHL